jgi:hypothetical protein
MGALLEGSRSFGTRTTIFRIPPMACPEETDTTSNPEEMEATNLGATLEETEAAVECQDLQMEKADVDAVGSSEDLSGYRRLVVRRRRGAKKRTQDSVGSRQKVSAAHKRVIRRAVPAVRKGNIRKGPGRNSVGRVQPKLRKFRKKQRNNSEYENGRLDRDFKEGLGLRMWRKSGGNLRKPSLLEMENLIVGSTTGAQDVIYWIFHPFLSP